MKAVGIAATIVSTIAFFFYAVTAVFIAEDISRPASLFFATTGVLTTLTAIALGVLSRREATGKAGISWGVLQIAIVIAVSVHCLPAP